jgi:adenosylcobinamide-GDP ribazoletransferase
MSRRSFFCALSFLTVFGPRLEPPPTLREVGASAWAFPIVGALIGLCLTLAHATLLQFFPVAVAAILVTAVWVALTGALHLDGWADCCDALVPAASPEKRRLILKDSRLGSFGAVGLTLLLGLKAAGVASLDAPALPLLLSPLVGRASLVWLASGAFADQTGMGGDFASGVQPRVMRLVVPGALVASSLTGLLGLISALTGLAGAFILFHTAQSRLGTVNGDVLGASCELCETMVLIIAAMR